MGETEEEEEGREEEEGALLPEAVTRMVPGVTIRLVELPMCLCFLLTCSRRCDF